MIHTMDLVKTKKVEGNNLADLPTQHLVSTYQCTSCLEDQTVFTFEGDPLARIVRDHRES